MSETGSVTAAAVEVAVTQPEHVTVNVVASGPAAGAQKTTTPEVSSTSKPSAAAAASDVKPAAAPASNPEPAKTIKSDAPSNPSTTTPTPSGTFQSKGDDFYNTIFYFSGMGSVIGNALAQGIYVSEQNRRNAIDPDDVGRKAIRTEQLVVTARGQAQNLSTDFNRLQSLLGSLPIFTGAGGSSAAAVADRNKELDQPIHGELYFRCKERFPVQPSPTPTSQLQTGRESVHERPRSRLEAEERARRRHDDAVLSEVTRAAVEAFPLLPPTTRGHGGASPAGSGRASRDRDAGAASPHHGGERRRRAQTDWSTETTLDVRPWQMSHVRQYDVIDGYPVHRP